MTTIITIQGWIGALLRRTTTTRVHWLCIVEKKTDLDQKVHAGGLALSRAVYKCMNLWTLGSSKKKGARSRKQYNIQTTTSWPSLLLALESTSILHWVLQLALSRCGQTENFPERGSKEHHTVHIFSRTLMQDDQETKRSNQDNKVLRKWKIKVYASQKANLKVTEKLKPRYGKT